MMGDDGSFPRRNKTQDTICKVQMGNKWPQLYWLRMLSGIGLGIGSADYIRLQYVVLAVWEGLTTMDEPLLLHIS